jgi:hypothetical protein
LDLFSSVVDRRLVRGRCELFVKEGLDQIRCLQIRSLLKKNTICPLARPQTEAVVERELLSLRGCGVPITSHYLRTGLWSSA